MQAPRWTRIGNRIRPVSMTRGQMPRPRGLLIVALLLVLALFLISGCSTGTNSAGGTGPKISIDLGDSEGTGNDTPVELQLILLLTALTLTPAILITITSFTRVIIVLSLIRTAIGIPQMPPNQLLVGLAFFLTVFIMAPVGAEINENALQPYLNGTMTQEQAFEAGAKPLKTFMLKQTREKDISLFVEMGKKPRPANADEVELQTLIPAFVISELKTAFQMGFMIFIPFLIIDMVVSSTLMSMGMMMLPPVMISLPFKLLLFILVDGWYLISQSIVTSFN